MLGKKTNTRGVAALAWLSQLNLKAESALNYLFIWDSVNSSVRHLLNGTPQP